MSCNFNFSLLRHVFNICIFLCFFYFPYQVAADPAIWEIKNKSNSVYLFGSIHVANESMYPLGATVQNAFDNSDVLIVEVDEAQADQVKLQELLMSRGFYPGAETVESHISKSTMKLLQDFLTESDIPYATVARMRPGLMAVTLTVAKIVQMGYSPELGIDRYFMNKARGKKTIEQLETAQAQMELLLSFSDDDLLLKHTLISLQEMDKMVKEMIDAWQAGDETKMETLMITDQLKEYPEFRSVFRKLIDDRNISMAINIQQLLNSNKNYFVVVGTGHLVGENGIVALMRKRGLNVKRL